jgi:hypothetical protein
MGTICLGVATFLNPFGFDILVHKLTQLTQDYWNTMFVLYLFAALSFGLSYLSFKLRRRLIGNWLLTIALFLNPLGYDIFVYCVTLITNDYWMTIGFMYTLTGIFFALFLRFYDINPVKVFIEHTKKRHNKLKKIKHNG